jgi:SPP1 gp7 family putative phage head morphogenesis protein
MLQSYIREMAIDVLTGIRGVWQISPPITVAQDAETVFAAGVMFCTTDGRILLMQRSDGAGWAFPGGGIEADETAEQAARREVREETAVRYDGPLKFLFSEVWRNVVFATFLAKVPETFVPMLNDEHVRYTWVSVHDALGMSLHPGVRSTLTHTSMAMDAKRLEPSELLRRALERWGGLWVRKLDRLSLDLATSFASKAFRATESAMKQSFKKAGFTVAFKPTKGSKQAFAAVLQENVGLIKSIPQQYLKDVESQVWQAVMRGSDLRTLTDNIQQKYGVAHRRAAFIARDQNAKAKATIENTRRLELGIEEAVWMHSAAGKEPRPTHVAMDGKTYKLKEGMYDSAEGEYILPGQLINCRCVSKAVIEGFE